MSSIQIPSIQQPHLNDPTQGCYGAEVNLVNSEALYQNHKEKIEDIDFIKANKRICQLLDCTVHGTTKTFALYNKGVDVLCMSLKTFCKILIHLRPPKKSKQMLLVQGALNCVLESVVHYDFQLLFKEGKTMIQEFAVFKELNTGLILGMDFITDHTLTILPTRHEFQWGGPEDWYRGQCQVSKQTKIRALLVAPVNVHLKTASGCLFGLKH